MALFMYSSQTTQPKSTQQYLGSVMMCDCCGGQKPKQLFKMINEEQICKECQEELLEIE